MGFDMYSLLLSEFGSGHRGQKAAHVVTHSPQTVNQNPYQQPGGY